MEETSEKIEESSALLSQMRVMIRRSAVREVVDSGESPIKIYGSPKVHPEELT